MLVPARTFARQVSRNAQVDWRAQLAVIQKQLRTQPDSEFPHNQAAVAYDALGDFQGFDREIHIAMKLDRSNPNNFYVAYAVYKRRPVAGGARSILKVLEVDTANPFGHYEMATILEARALLV